MSEPQKPPTGLGRKERDLREQELEARVADEARRALEVGKVLKDAAVKRAFAGALR